MPRYLRPKMAGGTFFFTVVIFLRRTFFARESSRRILIQAIREVQELYPLTIEALVLLPDHLHSLWTMPEGDKDFAKRWGLIKAKFSKRTREFFHQEDLVSPSRQKRRETTIWQRRFWEHAIRDERDFQKHFDYIHYNPVKHGLVSRARDWPYSTFHRFVRQGIYPDDWGGDVSFLKDDSFGE